MWHNEVNILCIVANSSDPVTKDLRSAWFLGPEKNHVTNLSVKLKGHKYFLYSFC